MPNGRERHQSQRSELASSHSSSPLRTAASFSSSNHSQAAPSTQAITAEALLAAYASAPHPSLAALDAAVAERNTLSVQNSGLWKLVEKHRTAYNQIMKELERVRSEREMYRSRLQRTGENTDKLLRAHREKEKKEGSLRSAVSQTHLRNSESGSSNTSGGALDPRGHIVRAYSDNTAPRLSQQQQQSQYSQHRSRDPLTEAHSSQTSLNSIPQVLVPGPSSRSSGQAAQSSQQPTHPSRPRESPSQLQVNHSGPNNARSGHAATPSIPSISETSSDGHKRPLHSLSPTERSFSSSSQALSTSTSSATAQMADSVPKLDVADPVLGPYAPMQPPPDSVRPVASVPPQVAAVVLTPPTPSPRSTAAMAALNGRAVPVPPSPLRTNFQAPQQPASSSSLSPLSNVEPSRPYALSRESRISLPEEAKRYYATMADSPKTSPAIGNFEVGFSSGPGSPLKAQAGHSPESPHTPGKLQVTTEENAPFLDMGDEDSMYGSVGGSVRDGSGQNSNVEDGYPEEEEDPYDPADENGDTVGKRGRGTNKRAVVEDFPLPPSTPPYAPTRTSGSRSRSDHSHLQAPAEPHTPISPFPIPLASTPPQMTFRELPLLASDLPNTKIQVVNSSIRPNDRGKEVLSFAILVDPGKGKDPWKVEKLYSDVLGLDARMRATVGKNVGKKMLPLPEGRLWRDHAPAKVDQRKSALELYLRSLIALPVKNKDEVIAFFTSDMVRETQKPVAQAGYKEGYLTKRGKNFGGWKTRYFVLQGPSLEYYESRGGAHLGSITITGAQIGRQQRAPDRKESDEESEYRHAFLIIEARKGPGGSSPRHVLCAESDKDRDSWVEELVRYVSGTYSEDQIPVVHSWGSAAAMGGATQQDAGNQPRMSTSSASIYDPPSAQSTPVRRTRDAAKCGNPKLSSDGGSMKPLPHIASYGDESMSSGPAKSSVMAPSPVDQVIAAEMPMSTSLPTSSPLVADDVDLVQPISQRANSELGNYPDLVDQRPVRGGNLALDRRKMMRMSVNPLKTAIPERTPSPEKDAGQHTPRVDVNGKVKISAPMNGTLIPAGYKFGGKDAPSESSVSSNERREKAKSRGFWGLVRQHDKPNVPTHIPRAVFGISLEDSLEVAELASLPAIVFRCIQYLEAKKAEQEEGIYRLSGSSAVIKALKDRFNTEGDIDLLSSDEYWDPHAIAGLLKTFLRDLPSSILTRDLHLRFLAVIDFVDPQERIKELSRLIASLPIANYSLLRALTAHLILIVQNAHVNKMTMRNVGIVFSPTLGIPAGVFSLMLGEFKRVFNVDSTLEADGDGEPSRRGQGEQEPGLDRRNSRHYTDAAADQLLGLSGRALPVTDEDTPSDEGEEASLAEESMEGTTENESDIVESSATSSSAHLSYGQQPSSDSLNVPTADQGGLSPIPRSRAAHLAASRGLNISTPTDKASRRRSHVVGLPVSPRPSPRTPNTGGAPSPPPIPPSPLPGGNSSPPK
ncbi:predicted protein [Sparassis crispa]|uniref:RhoGAP-domain-containing protein n=1 Tax=Sparassis crispa TaxID=139825 RepID=A0A401GW31_9APHY|nr:predicted protein [Sparassis crispa]GBE86392.1 predicted protein [Sparassis crispa]